MRYTSAYGAIGSFIALLLWCYYGISILFYGAEYVQVLEMRRAAKLAAEKSAEPMAAVVIAAPTDSMRREPEEEISKTKPRRVS
jgi:uncharacterized BrkB/YihY/UPF0761 family membrane protein